MDVDDTPLSERLKKMDMAMAKLVMRDDPVSVVEIAKDTEMQVALRSRFEGTWRPGATAVPFAGGFVPEGVRPSRPLTSSRASPHTSQASASELQTKQSSPPRRS